MYGTYQRFSYNTCPIRFPIGKAAKALLFVFVFAAMVVAGVAVFAAVHMLAVAALSVLASVSAGIVAALSAAFAVVVTVVSAVLSAAAYALVTLAAVAVIVLALVRALPWVWRAAVAVWAHRSGIALAAKGLCFAGVVISVFVVALVWLPAILTACCTVLPQVATVAGVLGGAIGLMKVG